MRLKRIRPRHGAGRMERALGRLVIPTAADPYPAGVRLNRYPGEAIGVTVSWGARRYLSWVWPVAFQRRRKPLPWPDVQECYGWDPNSRTAMELHPDPLCPQCDDLHTHVWVPGPRHIGGGRGVPVRCSHCGARKCDLPRCFERRHHTTPHTFERVPAEPSQGG